MKTTAPCRFCQDRELGCHATCEKYIAFKDERNAYLEDEYKRKQIISMSAERKNRAIYSKMREKKK